MDARTYCLYVLVMAGVTYLIRMIPLALFQRKLHNRFVQSFLFYVPYAVLGAMTFPDILYSTGNGISSLAGTATAFFMAWRGRSMVLVALGACAAALLTQGALMLL